MSQTLQIMNLGVLLILIGYGLNRLLRHCAVKKKEDQKKQEEDQERMRWERGAEIASNDKEYMAFVNDITGLGSNYDPATLTEAINLRGKPYGRDEWRYTMPESAIRLLEECFEGDGYKVNAMKRAIELSIEHYTYEMEDDAQCARIIEERLFANPDQTTVPFDIEEYTRYRKERKENDGEYETFTQWKQRHEYAASQEPADT